MLPSLSLLFPWFVCSTSVLALSSPSSSSNTGTSLVRPLAFQPPLTKIAPHLPLAREAMEYFDASTDPFHAVASSIQILQQAGYREWNIRSNEEITVGGKYYYTLNKSTLVAFCVGDLYNKEQGVGSGGGFKIIGGHTDSPNLRVKPRSARKSATDCIQVGAECYGGGLWHTWFDRDLGLSGRVFVRNNNNDNNTRIEQRLIQIRRALLRIPNLAIHLRSAKERDAFEVNKEDHLSPILAGEAAKALQQNQTDGWTEHQEPILLHILAAECNVNVSDIVDFELGLFDIQKASLGGAFDEFIHSARLDNLASCFLAVKALAEHDGSLDTDISMIVLYDHEEVGSTSAIGAASPVLNDAIRRITSSLSSTTPSAAATAAVIAKSFVISSDQAHAIHPNYAGKHEKSHQPKMNQGMVIKRNSNQRYATTALTGVLLRQVAATAGLSPPLQEFIVRQDCGCGSTIGPAISAATGIRTIDVGCPQLSMHSIRETMGVCDLTNGLAVFKAFFQYFRQVDDSVEQ